MDLIVNSGMEVHLHVKQSFALESYVPDHIFEFSDGTTTTAGARKIFLPPMRVTQKLLDAHYSVGLTPKVKVGQTINGLQVLVGLQGSYWRPLNGILEVIGSGQFLRSLFGGKARGLKESMVNVQVIKLLGPSTEMGTGPGVNRIRHHELTPTRRHKERKFSPSTNINNKQTHSANVDLNFNIVSNYPIRVKSLEEFLDH